MVAASVMPLGTLAKKDTISSTSEHNGIRIRPLKNMWMAKPASALPMDSQSSVQSRNSSSTTPPSVMKLLTPKNPQAIAPACTTMSTAMAIARNR